MKIKNLSFIIIISALSITQTFAGELTFKSLWYDEFKPTITESFDKTGQIIVASSFAAYIAARQVDEEVYRENLEEDGKYMDRDTAELFGTIGNGSYGIGVGLLQYFLDKPNGLKHLKAITLTSATHFTMAYSFQRKRPNGELNFLPFHSSFPSGHTQAAFTLAILLIIYIKRYHFLILFVACLMGISRIFMSMHFPSDIFFGAYLGAVIPILLYKNYYKSKIEKYDDKKLACFNNFIKLIYWRIFI